MNYDKIEEQIAKLKLFQAYSPSADLHTDDVVVTLQSLLDRNRKLEDVYEAACDQQAILSTKPLWSEIRGYATVVALGDAIEAVALDKQETDE